MAKRFRFRLEAVLKLRQRKVDEACRVVADRHRRIARVKDRIAACRAGIAEAVGQSRDAQTVTAPDVVMLRRYRSYIGAMYRAIAETEIELSRENQRLLQEQRQLAQVNKELKAIEKLRERQWARHRQADQRAERAENDEIALQLHRRTGATV